jgi:carboxyl-terminal processing protease
MLDDKVGYIAVSQFAETTYNDFVAAYEDLESQGMTSVIFDMRDNGGGLLDSVVDMLDYLLPKGVVVYTQDKYEKQEDFTSDDKHQKNIPMIVLVNGNTASAAEIFTGALRDFDYATIIGTKTFGKGIVQSTIPFSDGSAIKLTTQTYYTPSGECIQGKGINPDIELEFEFLGEEDEKYSTDKDNQIQRALEELKK